MLDTSDALEEKLASSPPSARKGLHQKKSYVDFAAFGTFKQANYGPDIAHVLRNSLGALAGRTALGSDESEDFRKLAAALLLDDVLLQQLNTVQDKTAVEACLRLNREHGTSLLRKLRR